MGYKNLCWHKIFGAWKIFYALKFFLCIKFFCVNIFFSLTSCMSMHVNACRRRCMHVNVYMCIGVKGVCMYKKLRRRGYARINFKNLYIQPPFDVTFYTSNPLNTYAHVYIDMHTSTSTCIDMHWHAYP